MIAKILIDTSVKSLNKIYDYIVPEELQAEVKVGKRVHVNFGKGKGQEKEGIIVKLLNDTCDNLKLKCITNVLDSESYIDENKLKLAKWISKVYFCNVYDALKLMLPPSTTGSLTHKELNGKQAKILCLAQSIEALEERISSGEIKSARHVKLIKYLMENEYIFLDDAIKSLAISKSVIATMEKNGYIIIQKIDIANEDYSKIERTEKLIPTEEQKIVIDDLIYKLNEDKFNVSLLKGVTGSGKTEVYLQAIEECIRLGRNAIVLVPEIALTFQTKKRFIGRFGDIVSVLHSKMTITERQTEIKRILKGTSKIVIGPRSALFVPMQNIGLIVIDEEHDSSYISQTTPKYNTKEVATRIAYQNNGVLLLGSATPEVSTMYKAKIGKIDIYEMKNRPSNAIMPEVSLIDMKNERLMGNGGTISCELIEAIKANIQEKKQTFIFLNRRGFASYAMCKNCGKIIKCRNCDVGMTYHKKIDLFLCHYCSYAEKLTDTCPYCNSMGMIDMAGIGTESVEQELREKLPGITTIRMDADTTVKRGAHEDILNRFTKDNINVLVGTQMISKGHDISNVTLVGIINADSTIAGNSFYSGEKGFSNLLQVSGRAGRGKLKGKVLIQTYDTENYIIDALKEQSYDDFYKKEIEFRKLANYPPFTDIILVELVSKFKVSVQKEAVNVYNLLTKMANGTFSVASPKAPYISRINNNYTLQIILKGKLNDKVYELLYQFLQEYDKISSRDVRISITKNPINI